MHMHHNAQLQHLVRAICIYNQCLLHSLPYHTMNISCLQGLLFHSSVYNTSVALCKWLCDEIAKLGAAGHG